MARSIDRCASIKAKVASGAIVRLFAHINVELFENIDHLRIETSILSAKFFCDIYAAILLHVHAIFLQCRHNTVCICVLFSGHFTSPSPGGVRIIVMSMLSVCLSVHLHNLKTTRPNFTKFLTHVARGGAVNPVIR